MKEQNKSLSTSDWNNMIQALCKSQWDKDGTSLFQQMIKKVKEAPHAATVFLVLKSLVRLKSLDCIMELLIPLIARLNLRIYPQVYTEVVKLCAQAKRLDYGRAVHSHLIKAGIDREIFIHASLINMYSTCGSLQDAIKVFNAMGMKEKDVYSCTAMISAYKRCGKQREALDLFEQMRTDGIRPNANTYNIVLTICADMKCLDVGTKLLEMIPASLLDDVFINSALINMYNKCGKLDEAIKIFNAMKKNEKDVVTWNAMISAYAAHGNGKQALALFDQMTMYEVKPNSITFVSLLTACSHSGLIDDALELFNSMDNKFGVQPSAMHRSCLIDALSRAGQLEKAEKFMNEIEEPGIVTLTTLLGACRARQDVERGERIFSKIIALNPSDASAYVLLANIYASVGRIEDAKKIRLVKKENGIKKIPGVTNITVDTQVYSFVSHDTSHARTKEIYEALHGLHLKMVERGYKADTNWVTRTDEEYSEEEKKQLLSYHSERIAIAFAIISTPEGSPIVLVNNIRICGDCHEATKYIAMVTGREITVRDASRFHHFTPDGKCSCSDYW